MGNNEHLEYIHQVMAGNALERIRELTTQQAIEIIRDKLIENKCIIHPCGLEMNKVGFIIELEQQDLERIIM